jgi:hypothetical protein
MVKSANKLLELIEKNKNVQIGSWKIGDFVTYKSGRNARQIDGVIFGVKNFKQKIIKIQVWLTNGTVLGSQKTDKFSRKLDSDKYIIDVLDDNDKTFQIVASDDVPDIVPDIVPDDVHDDVPDDVPTSPQLVLQRVAQSNNWIIGDLGRKEDPYASFIEEVDKIPLQDYSTEYGMIDDFFNKVK